MEHKILIIEDDVSFGIMLKGWCKRNGFDTDLCSKVEDAKNKIALMKFDLVLCDLRLPDGDGIMLLSWIKEKKIDLPVIIMTSYGEIQSAVASIKLGAFDYLEKPLKPEVIKQKIMQVFGRETEEKENPAKQSQSPDYNIVYGQSPAIKKMYEFIRLVAPTNMTVLIRGESGTGKESAAKMIHDNSPRKDYPFIAIDCGSLSAELAPSELFGHIKGSFTSAVSDKKGVFELAEGGTVFLDEIGNLPYEVQMQLLRALQEFRIRPVGAAKDINVDIRIIAATNEDLKSAIAENRFREDLYHRLDEFYLEIPPLRERGDDILIYAHSFLEDADKELDKKVKSFSEESIAIIKNYNWPGNLRELRNIVRRTVLFAKGEVITPEILPPSLSSYTAPQGDLSLYSPDEKSQIEKALLLSKGNKTKAAELLKIDRKTLYNKMHQYNMDIKS